MRASISRLVKSSNVWTSSEWPLDYHRFTIKWQTEYGSGTTHTLRSDYYEHHPWVWRYHLLWTTKDSGYPNDYCTKQVSRTTIKFFAPPTTFSVLWSGVAFFRLLGICDYSVILLTTIFSDYYFLGTTKFFGIFPTTIFFRLLLHTDYYVSKNYLLSRLELLTNRDQKIKVGLSACPKNCLRLMSKSARRGQNHWKIAYT